MLSIYYLYYLLSIWCSSTSTWTTGTLKSLFEPDIQQESHDRSQYPFGWCLRNHLKLESLTSFIQAIYQIYLSKHWRKILPMRTNINWTIWNFINAVTLFNLAIETEAYILKEAVISFLTNHQSEHENSRKSISSILKFHPVYANNIMERFIERDIHLIHGNNLRLSPILSSLNVIWWS